MRKTILVTGSASGSGKGIAEYFYNKNFNVIGVDIKRHNEKYTTIEGDLRQPEILAIRIKKLLEALYINRIDIFVNNAAIQIKKSFDEITVEDFNNSFAVNVIAPAILTKELKDYLVGSSVINIGSVHSKQSKPDFLVYSTTKGALKTLTQNLALELAPEIRVNCIEPAAINTPMLRAGLSDDNLRKLKDYHPLGIIGEPINIAKTIEFLHENSFITGTSIEVDGGISKKLNDPEN